MARELSSSSLCLSLVCSLLPVYVSASMFGNVSLYVSVYIAVFAQSMYILPSLCMRLCPVLSTSLRPS